MIAKKKNILRTKNRKIQRWQILGALGLFALVATTAFGKTSTPNTSTLQTKCQKGFKAQCEQLGLLLYENGEYGLAKQPLQKACFKKLPKACDALVSVAEALNDTILAKEARQESCRHGNANACDSLDGKINPSKEMLPNPEAKQLWSISCSKGSAFGCKQKGDLESKTGETIAAAESYRRACELGDAPSCTFSAKPVGAATGAGAFGAATNAGDAKDAGDASGGKSAPTSSEAH